MCMLGLNLQLVDNGAAVSMYSTLALVVMGS